MKLYHLLIPILFFISCNQAETEALTEELNTLKEENVELKRQTAEIEEKDSLINEYARFILDIQDNLNQIGQKENALILRSKDPEFNKNDEAIINDLKTLGSLLAENESKIKNMQNIINTKKVEISELESVIIKLTEQAEAKDVQIRGLKGELVDLGVAFDELLTAYEENIIILADKNQTIADQKDVINTAYYAFGSAKELKDNGVTTKEGAIIGIGGSKKLKDDFNKDYFKQINIEQTLEIPLNVKKAKLITSHPPNSYEIVGEDPVQKIKITNSKEFWSASKYLVIETK